MNKPNPDNRHDNVEKLQDMIENTEQNYREAEASMEMSNGEEQAAIEAKNERRKNSISAFREEIKDEAAARENGFQ